MTAILYRFLPSLKRLIWATLFIVTLNLFLVVQLPPMRSIQRHAKERHEQADAALRQFFGLVPSRLSCVVPDFPLFNEDFNQVYGREIEELNRDGGFSCKSPMSRDIDVELQLDETTNTLRLVKTTLSFQRCVVRCVLRDSDNEISFSAEQELSANPKVDCEFFRISCYEAESSSSPIYSDLFARISLIEKNRRSNDKKKRTIHQAAITKKKPFNILMFGMDGVSRQNFWRLMNKTRGFFEQSSDFVDFKIYNKVRDNTFVNIVPMTTGHFVDDLPWNESIASRKAFDDFDFIWKDFAKKLGYKTIYAEDFPEISIFNYLKFGFQNPPTDFYFRPMNLAMSADRDSFHGQDSLCFKNRFEVDYVFDFVRGALHQANLTMDPFFAFVYLTRITHENQALALIADRLYAGFFEKLVADDLMDPERTIVILFSDHGTRWGNYRTTLYGKYEERLPAFAMALPKSFKTEFPSEFENLVENSKKLVTPFDVYHSLVDLLHASEHGSFKAGKNVPAKKTGASLFGEISWSRSCEQVGVEQHWCACHQSTVLDEASRDSIDLALAVVVHLNAEILRPFLHECSNWTLAAVLEVRLLKPNDKFLLFKSSINDVNDRTVQFDRTNLLERTRRRLAFYLVTVLTKPAGIRAQQENGAVFEATVHARIGVDGSKSDLRVEGISRLNAYGSQSECLAVHSLKPFCYCNHH